MTQVYVTDHSAKISKKGGRLEISYRDGLLRSIPFEKVEGITIIGKAQMSTDCIGECLSRGIQVQYHSSRGYYFGKLSSTQHVNTTRQRLQIKLTEDKVFSLALSKNILRSKINNQIVLLKRYQRTSEKQINEEIRQIKILKDKIDSTTSLSESLGYEGNAARLYFKSLNILVNSPDFKFNGRNRRPPKDAFNSMLSLGYTILMNEIYGAIEGRGLNPYFGFIHQDRERHPTLASDLIEEWRAVIVDSITMSLINGNEISINNFYRDEKARGVFFDKEGLGIFLKKLEKRLETSMKYLDYISYSTTFRKAIDLQAQQLCKAIEENNPYIYEPICIR